MRAIDADRLLKQTINNPCHAPYITAKDVKDAPTIELPEIIRCKDCKKYEQRNGKPSGVCTRFGYAYRPDDFCSRAERREESKDENQCK